MYRQHSTTSLLEILPKNLSVMKDNSGGQALQNTV